MGLTTNASSADVGGSYQASPNPANANMTNQHTCTNCGANYASPASAEYCERNDRDEDQRLGRGWD